MAETDLGDNYEKADIDPVSDKGRRHSPCNTCSVETGIPVGDDCFFCRWFWYE
jgi:hypothetical protein